MIRFGNKNSKQNTWKIIILIYSNGSKSQNNIPSSGIIAAEILIIRSSPIK